MKHDHSKNIPAFKTQSTWQSCLAARIIFGCVSWSIFVSGRIWWICRGSVWIGSDYLGLLGLLVISALSSLSLALWLSFSATPRLHLLHPLPLLISVSHPLLTEGRNNCDTCQSRWRINILCCSICNYKWCLNFRILNSMPPNIWPS